MLDTMKGDFAACFVIIMLGAQGASTNLVGYRRLRFTRVAYNSLIPLDIFIENSIS